MRFSLAILVFVAASSVESEVLGKRVLVLLENLTVKETHSIYFKWMVEQGFDLSFKVADDSGLSLKKYGEPLYDHLVIFSPTVEEFGGSLSVEALTDFVDDGGNVLVAGSSNMGEALREFASEVGFEADEDGTAVIDHLNYDSAKDTGAHTLVVVGPQQAIKCTRMVGEVTKPLLYRGAGLLLDPENPLVLPILTGSSTSYSHNPQEPVTDFPHAVGKQTVLIAGLQARNNARVVFSGSLEFFSDEFFLASAGKVGSEAVGSGNLALAKSLTQWVLKQNGVLKVEGLSHHKQGETQSPGFYTIMELAQYNIQVSELVHGTWEPFKGEDMQMEFVRIDPFVRVTMDNNNGLLTGKFKVPDTYGVYQFKVNYQRLGLTRLSEATQISVVPLRHDQYERFIGSAHPYYASSFSMMAGVFIFALVFLHYKEESSTDSKKKSE